MTTATLTTPNFTQVRKRQIALKRFLDNAEALRVFALFGDQRIQHCNMLKRLYPSTPHWEKLVKAGLIHSAGSTQPGVFIATNPATPLADWVSQQPLKTSQEASAVLCRIREANFNSFRTKALVQAYYNGGCFPDGVQIHPSTTLRDAIWTGLRKSEALVNQQLTPFGAALARWYN